MKLIELTQNKQAIVDDEDYDYLNSFKWCYDKKGYACRHLGIKRDGVYGSPLIYMHQEILKTYGTDIVVDHIDGNGLSNSKLNIRKCTSKENTRNYSTPKNNTSGYKGVDFKSNKWRSQIMVNKIHVHLGYFNTKIEAAIAYNEAASMYFGEFAKLNII